MSGFSASASGRLRANRSVIATSRQVCSPASAPQKTTSLPASSTPTSTSSGASGVPAQVALPTRPLLKGNAELPEHSRVKVTSRRARALRWARLSVVGFATRPPIARRQSASVRAGWSKCLMTKNWSGGVSQESSFSHSSWRTITSGTGLGSG